RLYPHAACDEPFAPNAIGKGSSEKLSYAPDSRVDGGQPADSLEGQPRGCVEQRKQSPRHPVVEIVNEARLAHRRQVAIVKRSAEEDLALRDLTRGLLVLFRFLPGMAVRFTNQSR